MRRPSIRTALMSMLSVLGIGILALCYLSISGLKSTNEATEEISTNWLPSVSVVNQINTATSDFRIAEGAHIMSTTDDEMAKAESDQKTLKEKIKALRTRYEALISSDLERQIYDRFSQEWVNYEAFHERIIALSRKNQNAEAAELFKGEARVAFDNASAILDEAIKLNTEGSQASYEMSQQAYSATSNEAYAAGFVMILVIGASMYFAASGISRPINEITAAMRRLAAGDDQSAIPFGGRRDEIGSMAAAVEVFRQTALAKTESDRLVEASRSQSERDRLATEAADRARAAAMEQATTGLASGLRSLAAGDMTARLSERFADEYEQLRHDFNDAVETLSQTLATVANAANTIDNGSREIAGSAGDLSKRTEQQAAALEETAAALEQITANVVSSSKRVQEAQSVASDANASAARSGQVVAEAVSAMSRIEESSRQISNIIGVIDEIAFQTNLLALNAGVEAARAGDAGKGFAVVAQEVRELAQRSAQAAKEIKGLIQTSSAEVGSGVKLVSETGQALKAIGDYIVDINQHMNSIATAAREQATGLAEVNTAVNQMDQTTQKNAAMVEETSAASGALASESNTLRDLISKFKVGQATPSHSARPVQDLQQTAARMAAPVRSAPIQKTQGNAAVAQEWAEF